MKARQNKVPKVQYNCGCDNSDLDEFTLIPMTGYMFVSCNCCGRMYRVNPAGKEPVKIPIIEWIEDEPKAKE